ncbi:MAG: DUF6232 family protein [Chloroflexia bacterium]
METTYYTDGVVWVTNQRVVFVDTTYWLAEIDRLEVVTAGSRRYQWIELAVCLCVLSLLLLIEARSILQGADVLQSCGAACIGVLVICLLCYCARTAVGLISGPHEDLHIIRLHMPRGRIDAYCSLDRAYVVAIVNSIAMVSKAYEPNGAWPLAPYR